MTVVELSPFNMLVPLIASAVCALLPGRLWPWLVAFAATLAGAVIAAITLDAAMDGTLSYAFGDWQPPIGIEYRIDAANAFVALLVSAVAAAILPWAKTSVDHELPERQGPFYALFLLALAGLIGITLTGDAFNLFVFLEISSLATYALIAHGRDRQALLAAFRYLIMGTVGATFLLLGIGFLYMVTGTLNMADLAQRLPELRESATVRVALAFIVVGTGLKLALLPLHLWLPNAYTFAPSFVSVFLAATATKVALYVLLRFTFTVFAPDYSLLALPLAAVLMALGIAGMVAGSLVAIYQANIKRMLAYSSVAQVGYMVLGVSLVSVTGLTAALLHMFNHALMKAALFMALGVVAYQVGSVRIEAFRGLGRRMPWTMAAFALAGVSLIGLPPTAGFVSKWYLISSAVEAGHPALVVLIVLTSMMALIYIWRVVEAAWFRETTEPASASANEAPLRLLIPVWLLVAANFWFGIDTRLNVGAANAAAQALMSGIPGASP